MRKNILLFAMIISLATAAQDSHMDISMGGTMPLGDFASTGDFLQSGYAKPGFCLTFDGNYIPTWYFGVGATFSFSSLGVDKEAATKDYFDFITGGDDPIIDIPEGTEIAFGMGNWSYVNCLVGPTFTLPGDIFQVSVKALFGASFIMPPAGSIEVLYEDQHYMTYNKDQKVGFGYQFGTDLIYMMRGGYSLKIAGDYFGTRTQYDVVTDFGEIDVTEEIASAEKDIKIQSVQLTIGLAYMF